MIYYIAQQWVDMGGPKLLTYITARALFGFITALLISLWIGRPLIRWLFEKGYKDYPRNYGSISVSSKEGTPTMGGVIILVSSLISMLLW